MPQRLRSSLRLPSQLTGRLQRSLDLGTPRQAPLQLLDPAERPLQPGLLLSLLLVRFGVVGEAGQLFERLCELRDALCELRMLGGQALYLRAGVAQLSQTVAAGAGRFEVSVGGGHRALDAGFELLQVGPGLLEHFE